MQSDDPAFLPVGTEVSAKFKGAFCEAKVKKITRTVKLRVSLKEQPFGNIQVDDTSIRSGNLALNELVEVQHGKHVVKGIIVHVKDCSSYHVVFNDGDEKTLRRTQMCLKGAKHFDAAVNLDAMPLYNPEQFSSPVVKGGKKSKKRKVVDDGSPSKRAKRRKGDEEDESDDEKGKKREKRAAASAATVAIGEMDQGETELSGEASSVGDVSDTEKEKERSKPGVAEKPEEPKEKDKKTTPVKAGPEKKPKKLEVGDVVAIREAAQLSAKWYPGVVVSIKAYKKALPKAKPLVKKEIAVRSFQNGKYFAAESALVLPFVEQYAGKKNQDNLSTALKTAVDRAQSFLEKDTLPGNWEHADIFGENGPSTSKKDEATDKLKERQKKKDDEKEKKKDEKYKKKEKKPAETESSSSESSGEEDYGEERDIFVAQLYKFQEERGTPINRAPVLGGKDIDLYRFYRVVQHYGGLKKATANGKWKKILGRMKLEGCAGATPVTVKNAYSRYLAHFNSFYKRLGWSLDELASTTTINSPRERRLIRPQNVDNKVKRRKSNAADLKEKEKAKKKDEESKEKEAQPTTTKSEESVIVTHPTKQEVEDVEDEEQAPPSEGSDVSKIVAKKKVGKEKKQDDSSIETGNVPVASPRPVKERRDSTRSTSDKKEKKEKLAKDSDSERAKEKDTKVDKKEKKDIESEEDGPSDGKRRKERRKISMKSPKFDLEPMYEDDEPGYSQTDILQHFYMGQKVRSFHHGRWYDARVISCDQTPKLEESIELVTVSSDEDPINPGADFKNNLVNIMRNAKCLVHYLGWNSRYDELMPLNKVRVSLKDEINSLELIRNGGKNKISEDRMNWILNWCHSSEGISSMPLDFDRSTPTPNMNFMNGYRPRRVSISQIEQINAAVEGLKREQNKASPRSVISPTPSIMSSPSSSTYSVKVTSAPSSKREEVEEAKPCTSASMSDVAKEFSKSPSATPSLLKSPPSSSSPVSVMKSPARESRRQHTTSHSKEQTVNLPVNSSPRKSQSPIKLSLTPGPPTSIDVPTEQVPVVPTELPDSSMEAIVDEEAFAQEEAIIEDVIEESEVSFSVVEICEDVISTPMIEAVSRLETLEQEPVRAPSLAPQIIETEEVDADEEMIVDSMMECVSIRETFETPVVLPQEPVVDIVAEFEEKADSPTPDLAEPSTEDHVDEVEEPEIISSKFEDDLLDEALVECSKAHPDEDVHSEGGISGSDTPHRTDGEDVDVEKVDDSAGRLVSPSSRGRGMKRKRFAHRHSQMVVDRKYMKHKPSGKDLDKKDPEDGSEDEEPEEEGTVARSTFNKQKNAMHKLMEQEKSLHDVSYLGLQPIEDFLHLPMDDVIHACSQRLEEMREMYLQARHEILMVERRWKAQNERKKEKALQKERECPSAPGLPLPVPANGEKSDVSK